MKFLPWVRAIIASAVFLLTIFGAINAQTKDAAKPGVITSEQKTEIEKIVRDYLIRNPQVMREVFQALQQQEEAKKNEAISAALKANDKEIYSDPDSHFAGNPNGDVSIVVFFDYFCGYCKRSMPGLAELAATDKSLRLIYKELPILSAQSTVAARAALAAAKQGKYAEFHKEMNLANNAREETIKGIAEKIGLDHALLQKDMKDPKITAALARTSALAEALGVDGTPAYIIGGQVFSGAIEKSALIEMIAKEREKLANKSK